MLSRIPLITGLVVSLAFAGQQQAHAADRGDVAAGVVLGAVVGGVLASQRPARVYEPAPVYHAPPVAYYPAQPVYYQPRPVYYERRPVYYSHGPVYYVPATPHHHKHKHKRHRRHHHDHW